MLNKEEIKSLIKKNGLIKDFINLETQLTPNGFDLTVEKVFNFDSNGALDFSNSERVIPKGKEILPKKIDDNDEYGWWNLEKGVYKIRTNETVNFSKDLTAISFPRSSLLRMGAFTQTGVWDAGFRGKGEFVLVVENTFGIKIKQNARVAQLVFLKMKETKKGYQGIYKNIK